MPNQSETSIPKNYSAVTRWWMPYKYLTLAEKFFLFINILGLLLLFFSLFVGISRVIQGKYYSFGLGNSIFLFAIMQSLPALRYRGLTRIPTDKLDEKLQNQIAQWCKFKWMYSLKFSVFCWLLWVGLSAFSLYLIFQVFP
ncbi:hypothetical protein ISS85_01845 [Candidatus Microgenomates bacterium]|nr:hypothetical protein [Candidatus Microgenomates bacterium]